MIYKKALLDLTFFEVEDVITTSNVGEQVPPSPPVGNLPPKPAPQPIPPVPED